MKFSTRYSSSHDDVGNADIGEVMGIADQVGSNAPRQLPCFLHQAFCQVHACNIGVQAGQETTESTLAATDVQHTSTFDVTQGPEHPGVQESGADGLLLLNPGFDIFGPLVAEMPFEFHIRLIFGREFAQRGCRLNLP